MASKSIKNFFKFSLFLPILLYVGERSYLSYDEGFYALQARWIIQNKNWIIPTWWGEYSLDRTIGIQFIIAKSQEIFGDSSFAAHLPVTLASALMLFVTYKLHQILIDKQEAIFSVLILSTTYLWFNFAHLATQDIVFSLLVNLGLFSFIKCNKNKYPLHLFLFGAWIGLAFMMKTFLVFIPIFAILPFLFFKKEILLDKSFLIGILIGFVPFTLWSISIDQFIDRNIFIHLFDKLNDLSSKNTFTNPFYYYFWNIPINFVPWSLFTLIGLISNYKKIKEVNPILVFYPILFIFLISFFSTKTPYYALPISPILSLNSYVGIKETINSKRLRLLFKVVVTRLIPSFIFLIIAIYFFIIRKSLNFNLKEEYFLILGLILFSLSWLLINQFHKPKHIVFLLILGPYLLTASIVQSGLITDRSRAIRESLEYCFSKNSFRDEVIQVNKNDINNDDLHSKIIKISLLTPKLGKGINGLKELKDSEYAWSTLDNKVSEEKFSYQIIFTDNNIKPWKLIKKKYTNN